MTTQPMSLDYALNHISHVFGLLTPADVIPFAALDPHGGYHALYDDGFPIGSMWRVEGQFLYALVRALRPLKILELGTARGCSATHILQAIDDNGEGVLECVDSNIQPGPVADLIPDKLRGRMRMHLTTVEDFLENEMDVSFPPIYDLILEDAIHTAEQVALVWGAAARLLKPGGMIISHDAMHVTAGPLVREGIERAGYEDTMGYGNGVMYVLIEPADCGFAIWRKRFTS